MLHQDDMKVTLQVGECLKTDGSGSTRSDP